MHKFVTNLKKDEYNKFYDKYSISFMQSYEWGIFSKHSKNQYPHYVGIKDGNKILCEALLLEKKGPFGLSFPGGPDPLAGHPRGRRRDESRLRSL